MQLVAYFSRVGRICPTSVIGRQVGAEFFGENPSLGGSGEQVGRRGFGSPGNSEVRITVFPLPEHVALFLSHSATVSELFGRLSSVPGCLSGGMGEPRLASACGSLRFAVSYRARVSPGVCLITVWWMRQHVRPREAVRADMWTGPRVGTRAGFSELVSSPQRSNDFGMRGDFAPHPPLIAIVFRTHVVGRSLRGGVIFYSLAVSIH